MSVHFSKVAALVMLTATAASAQQAAPPAPAVGVMQATRHDVTQADTFVARIAAMDRVDLQARVTAFMQERLFQEGTEVKAGDLLFRLEREPFEASVAQAQGALASASATLVNARIQLARARELVRSSAGTQARVDDATANEASDSASVMQAQAALTQAQINLGYTEIRAPVSGKIGRASVTAGNVVSPTSGVLATIVSQDPMFVEFPVSTRAGEELRQRYSGQGGLAAITVQVRLANGTILPQAGTLDFVNNQVDRSTDTIMLRATIPNPPQAGAAPNSPGARSLIEGQVVTAILAGKAPVQAITIPQSALLSDQLGAYVFIVDDKSHAQIRRIHVAGRDAMMLVVRDCQNDADTQCLKGGESVIVEGIQRVRPGQPVQAGPATPSVQQPARN